MNYQKVYNNLIDSRKNRAKLEEYVERHHIVPYSMGGSSDCDNLIDLTPREHFIAHWLLYKIYKGTCYEFKMAHAFKAMAMLKNGKRYISSRGYKALKTAYNQARKGVNVTPRTPEYREKMSIIVKSRTRTDVHKQRVADANRRKSLDPEFCKAISERQKGKKHSAERKRKNSQSLKGRAAWNRGIPHSQETKQKIAEKKKGKKSWNSGKTGYKNRGKYDHLKQQVIELYTQKLTTCAISKALGVNFCVVKRLLDQGDLCSNSASA